MPAFFQQPFDIRAGKFEWFRSFLGLLQHFVQIVVDVADSLIVAGAPQGVADNCLEGGFLVARGQRDLTSQYVLNECGLELFGLFGVIQYLMDI